MNNKNKRTTSIKHKNQQRPHIPSREEAGYEKASPQVRDGKTQLSLPNNPIVERGQDPELFWLKKYRNDDREDLLRTAIRSLYRKEHVAPETLISQLYKYKENGDEAGMVLPELFANEIPDELGKVQRYYKHSDTWTNRLILGDALLVMTSLLEREGMQGKVQTVYMDPPYGIKYGSNWQMKHNKKTVSEKDLSAEPETIKAYRDTWELGIHSYLSFLRDRFLLVRELLADAGSCFVQISDANMHLVRSLLDEVFGSENFIVTIILKKTGGHQGSFIEPVNDYILWYTKDKELAKGKNNTLFEKRKWDPSDMGGFDQYENEKGELQKIDEHYDKNKHELVRPDPMLSSGFRKNASGKIKVAGKTFDSGPHKNWKVVAAKIKKLEEKRRLILKENGGLYYKRYFSDFPLKYLTNVWSLGGASNPVYVVQTNVEAIKRCILMTSDPGDLVLDPTCGSGTTAFVAEQWGRRWITIDTSRIALNIAKIRLMTAVYPYYKLEDGKDEDIRQGFTYKSVNHLKMRAIADDEPPEQEVLYDDPKIDQNVLRVSGPFTVETLQNYNAITPGEADMSELPGNGDEQSHTQNFLEEQILELLKSAGIKNGLKEETVRFNETVKMSNPVLHAYGYYEGDKDQRKQKAYFHLGPPFGTVSRLAVNEAIKAVRDRGDADWLVILGFSFESDVRGKSQSDDMGNFIVSKVRMDDSLMQEGLIKKDRQAGSFILIGEPDICLKRVSVTEKGIHEVQVEIGGLDIYDPIKDEIKTRDKEDIAYWMVDTDYNGSDFMVRQFFFCGSEKRGEFDSWKKGIDELVEKKNNKKRLSHTLKIEIDNEAFSALYGFESHSFSMKDKQKVAVLVVSQFGEESMKVFSAKDIDKS